MLLQKKLALGFTALAAGPLLQACTTTNPAAPLINAVRNPIPSVKTTRTLDAENCVKIVNRKSNPGILFFLPSFNKTDATQIDEQCVAAKQKAVIVEGTRKMALALIDTKDSRLQAIAISAYDHMTPVEQDKVKAELLLRNMTIEDVRKNAPRVLNTTSDDKGITVFYKMPGDDEKAPPSMHYRLFPETKVAPSPAPEQSPQP